MTWSDSTPIVVFGDDWGRHVSSMQHVFRPILGRHPVIWVNAIGHGVPQLSLRDARRILEKGRRMLRPAAGTPPEAAADSVRPLEVIHPRVLPWHHWGPVHAANNWSLIRAIRAALAAHRLTERPVLVTGTPPSVGVVGRLDEQADIYFCMDDFLHLPGVTASMIAPLEQRLLGMVDAVVATARSLTISKRPRSGVAHHLPQGVNYDHFATPQPEPAGAAGIPRPWIGFAGGVSGACDMELIARLADTYPRASVVLVGPVTVDLAPVRRPNVHVLGPAPYAGLPAWVQRFDVGIIPYVLNDWTRAVDPLKLLEYLAAGAPVVTTAIPEVAKYADAVAIADTPERFVAAVGEALARGPEATRDRGRALARRHTWAHRADELLRIIGECVERRSAGRSLVTA